MNCDGCHGGDGSGWVGPNLADGRWRYGGADAEVFNSIYYGRPKGMPAFGGTLGAEGVWTVVTYIRSLPVPGDVPTESWVMAADSAVGADSVNRKHQTNGGASDPHQGLGNIHSAKAPASGKGPNAPGPASLPAELG